MSELSDFPTQQELDGMSKDELNELWKRLIGECNFSDNFREGAIACRAFDIGWRLKGKAVER